MKASSASLLKTVPLYALLALGAAVFSLPFLWMAMTSFKVDRELYTEELDIFPMAPVPREKSPYIDELYYRDVGDELFDELRPQLIELAVDSGIQLPDDVDRDAALAEIAKGLYRRLSRRIPGDIWNRGAAAIATEAPAHVTRQMTEEMFAKTHRRLALGRLRVWSASLQQQTLGERDGRPLAERFENLTPAVATLHDREEKSLPFASLNYDFSEGAAVRLAQTFELEFPARDLDRLQLYMRPDDTWHELTLVVEKNGRRYVAERPHVLSNFEWTMLTWQWPGPDDSSTKIKTWILLEDNAPGAIDGENEVRLTLELNKVGSAGAWSNKLALNYERVVDHMPFWRYVRVSIFLVVANVLLTVFASSLVAYAFARLEWPGRNALFVVVLATLMIPHQATMIPQFLVWKNLGAYDTLVPLWLPAAFGNAFFIFLIRQFMKGIPRDLEDAARIDGCGFLRICWHVVLPLIRPSLAAIAIFTFMGPLIYVSDQRLYPLAFGLYAFSVQVGNNPALTMAASLLMTVPVIIIFFFAQRYFIQGVTLTGMKG
jgi:multiple sugar transport system permease protein